jgi:hypothetical protein
MLQVGRGTRVKDQKLIGEQLCRLGEAYRPSRLLLDHRSYWPLHAHDVKVCCGTIFHL